MATDTSDLLAERARTHYTEGPLVPKEVYTSREYLARENERLWRRTWQVACRASELPEVGDFCEYEIAGESVLVVRRSADEIVALSNVCRHRGTLLRRGKGHVNELACPFHGWTYGLDGTLEKITNAWDFPHVDVERTCLPRFPCETWSGWVFVNLDPGAEDLRHHLGPVAERLERFRMEDYVRMMSVQAIVPANWKATIEAFIEVYHGPWTHPQTATYLGDERTATMHLFGRHGMFLAEPGPSGNLPVPPDDDTFVEGYVESMGYFGLDPDEVRLPEGVPAADYIVSLIREAASRNGLDVSRFTDRELYCQEGYFLFPNVFAIPGPGSYGLYHRIRPNGDDPDSCVFELNLLRPLAAGEERPPDAETQVFPPGSTWQDVFGPGSFFGLIFDQDTDNLRRIQQGLKSAYYPGVNLGLYQESLIRHFHEVLDEYVGAEPAGAGEGR